MYHFCVHTQTGPGEPPGDGEMTLPSRHRSENQTQKWTFKLWRFEVAHVTFGTLPD